MTDRLLLTLLGPVLLAQGKSLRRNLPLLPEPPGPREGLVGEGPPLSVLVLGDSSAAGVGADSQDQALLGHLLGHLSSTRSVRFRLEARTGATTRYILKKLEAMPAESFDVAVTALGANDATRLTEPAEFLELQHQLMAVLKEKFQVSRVIASGLPPMHLFPAMPQPLRWVIGRRARQLDAALARGFHEHPLVTHLTSDYSMDVGLMASDGFHPGPDLYRMWAQAVAQELHS